MKAFLLSTVIGLVAAVGFLAFMAAVLRYGPAIVAPTQAQVLVLTPADVAASCRSGCDPKPVDSWDVSADGMKVTAHCQCIELNIGGKKPIHAAPKVAKNEGGVP